MSTLQGTVTTQKKEFEEKEEQLKQNIEALRLLAEKSQNEKAEIETQLKIAQESHVVSSPQTAEPQSPKETAEFAALQVNIKYNTNRNAGAPPTPSLTFSPFSRRTHCKM